MILCAGRNETFDFAKPIGVGLIESAINLTKLVLEEKPAFLFFVGTAGSYGNHQPLDLIYSHRAANIELGYLQNQCYTPLQNQIEADTIYVSRGTNHSSPCVNSSNYITTDATLANEMLTKNIELENMEFFSIVSVANQFRIPCSGLFVVTNYCDENAHSDFIKNHAQAKALITLHVEKNMKI
ncbi:phosphorylase family protein [Sulfurospirillum multivorans]|uniref:Nucleoside phosphorylase n=2 Tax=Sulfurospirillum multivorans TaxID=66821 RepID=A0AA86E153_SULMK|nr:purine-nucleoside phosphorylase [Sulfurospirillum multivorans]AHJ11397.1 putative nucleoside phosphorylase [Sulfurospirillum multivorans DSM 12446]QEH04901.1 putative nucleoside phosphorylase [Sulfurospirillum multivorans]